MTIRKNLIFTGVSLSLVLLIAGAFLVAQEEATSKFQTEQTETLPAIPKFYFGIQCVSVPKLLETHLNLGRGLLVQAVVPDGPAEKAGIKQDDIILSVGGKDIHAITDIFSVLEKEQEKELLIEVMQNGKKNELRIIPEERPEMPPARFGGGPFEMRQAMPFPGFEGRNPDAMHRQMMELIEQLKESNGVRVWEIPEGPFFDQVFPANPNANVDQIIISITKDGAGNQQIRVRQNNEEWQVERIEDLPEDLQEKVQRFYHPVR